MPFVLIIIGVILPITAIKNTQGNLATALETDVPASAKWVGAMAVVGSLGYVPGMAVVSRWLLGLVLVVIVLGNYAKLFAGLSDAFTATAAPAGATTPAQAYVANPTSPGITQADITGTTATGTTATGLPAVTATPLSWMQQFAPQAAADFAMAGGGSTGLLTTVG
jgi:hypothetical protein